MLIVLIISLIIISLTIIIIFNQRKDNSILIEKKIQLEQVNNELLDKISIKEELLENETKKSIKIESEKNFLKMKIEEQKQEVDQIRKRMTSEFKNMAQEILDEKSQKFTDQNKTNLETLLTPFKNKILEFQKQIEDTNKEGLSRNIALRTEIQKLSELNHMITKEASALTKAIKGDSKIQGNWGEIILESILEKSGLRKDYEYVIQETFKNEMGQMLRPDVIVKLPEGKNIVIDAKMSLTDYEKYMNEPDEHMKSTHLKKHLYSIRTHIKTLSEKNYHIEYNLQSLDFVLMFIPLEPAFSIALQADVNLFAEAYDKNIVIVSPTTLIATLKTISSIWKTEYQNRNVIEIAKQGGALYDKFVSFVEDLKKVGKKIESVNETYKDAAKKLYIGKDNLVRKTERLKELGAKTSKSMDNKLLEKATDNESGNLGLSIR